VPPLLLRPNLGRDEDIDVALNGYEYTPERHAETPGTIPYFVYTFRLIGRKDDPTVNSWHTLGKGEPRKKVGVLNGSAAHRYLEARYGDAIEVMPSKEVTEMFGKVIDGTVDCTVQDSPAASFYIDSGRYPALRTVDEPVGTGFYVILTRPEDVELRDKLNAAIREAVRSGWLRDLYKKYQLWDAAQQRLAYLVEQPWPAVADEITQEVEQRPPSNIQFSAVIGHLLWAAGMTVLLAVVSFPPAVMLGVVVAVGRVYGPWPVRFVAGVYVEVLRGTPLLLQLFVIFYLIPRIPDAVGAPWLNAVFSLPPLVAGVLGLVLNYSANEAENYRAGLQAIPKGQTEAALALGMSRWAILRRIVLPQAFRIVLPPVTNDFIALFKDTAVCSTILIVELTGLYYKYKMYPGLVFELAVAVGVLYLLMSYPLSVLAGRLEKHFGKGEK
jgi:polar amino acid transport system substrate-binding protein